MTCLRKLLEKKGSKYDQSAPLKVHYSMLPTFGYPLTGCPPAEHPKGTSFGAPVSVSPNNRNCDLPNS